MEDIQEIALSVIVPCYNVEPYLDRSLGCLERQWNGRTDYEIILVNDASTDGTILKLNEFRNRYPNNVIVIDKAVNEGVGMARNSGLDVAKGKWIAFMDPDDALVDNAYYSLLDLTEQELFDIISFGAKVIKVNEWNDCLTNAHRQNYEINWSGSAQEYMLSNHTGTCFRFLFRQQILTNHRFSKLAFLEDVVFLLPVFLRDSVVAMTQEEVYLYILRTSSATNMIDSKQLNKGCDDILTALQLMDECKLGQNDAIKNRISERQCFYRMNLITRLFLSSKSLNEIKRHHDEIGTLSIPIIKNMSVKERFYVFLFDNPWLIVSLRPLYRTIRFFHSVFLGLR